MNLAACCTAVQSLLFSLLLTTPVSAEQGQTRLATRYGDVEAVDSSDAVTIRAQGKVVRSIGAIGATLHRLIPRDEREFILVDALTPGLHCHHFFALLELSADGKAVLSQPFGECKELQGVVFHGDVPVIRLCEPYVADRKTPTRPTDFEWRNGAIRPTRAEASPTRRTSPPLQMPACVRVSPGD